MKIVIESIPHDQQRYPTCGDYWIDPDGTIHIRVSAMADQRHEHLVAIHELAEVILTEHRGVPEESIKAFDEAHLDADEPGALAGAPYFAEHAVATEVEAIMAEELDVDMADYDQAVLALFP